MRWQIFFYPYVSFFKFFIRVGPDPTPCQPISLLVRSDHISSFSSYLLAVQGFSHFFQNLCLIKTYILRFNRRADTSFFPISTIGSAITSTSSNNYLLISIHSSFSLFLEPNISFTIFTFSSFIISSLDPAWDSSNLMLCVSASILSLPSSDANFPVAWVESSHTPPSLEVRTHPAWIWRGYFLP